MAGAHRHAIGIEECSDVMRVDLVDHEGEDGGFVRRGANNARPSIAESFSGILEQGLLVGERICPV